MDKRDNTKQPHVSSGDKDNEGSGRGNGREDGGRPKRGLHPDEQ